MHVLVITSRDLEKGSTKYRMAQYTDFLKSKGIDVAFIKRHEITRSFARTLNKFDLVLNQKCLMNTTLSRHIISHSKRVIFDFDDAIYTRPGRPYTFLTSLRVQKRFRFWLQHADTVTTANQFLADKAGPYASSVIIVPMAVDIHTWRPPEKKTDTELTLGWAGSPGNIKNVEQLEHVISVLLRKYPSLKFAVFSGAKPRISCAFEFYPFESGKETQFIQRIDIGLLPLPDEEYSKGKSPIKAIQYLACGVPVVGNVSGATAEILNEQNSIAVSTHDEWISAIEKLIQDASLRKAFGEAGRQFVVSNHNMDKIKEQLLTLFVGNENR